MKKVFIILVLVLLFGNSKAKANPLPLPPMISEIYLDSLNWFIELNYCDYFGYDSLRMISNSDTAYLSDVGFGQIIIITRDSLQTPFNINRNGDYLELQMYSGSNDWFTTDALCWGAYSCNASLECNVNSPLQGQSLVVNEIEYYGSWIDYWLVKDKTPSLGTNIYHASTRGNFCGYVFDHFGNPVKNILLRYCQPEIILYNGSDLMPIATNSNGYFFDSHLYCKNYNIIFCENSPPYENVILDTIITITIESDSINYYEFILDTVLTGIKVTPLKKEIFLTAYPNPTTGETTISFEIPNNLHFSKALIKVYNSIGEIISILPVNAQNSQNKYTIKWNSLNCNNPSSPGIYYYNLELDGQKVASDKIVLTK